MQSIPYTDLSRLPVLQYVVSILVIATWLLGVFHAFRSKPQVHQSKSENKNNGGWFEQRWFWDGPIKTLLENTEEMKNLADKIDEKVSRAISEFGHRHEQEVETLKNIEIGISGLRELMRDRWTP